MTTVDDEVERLGDAGELEPLADALVRRATQRLQHGRFAEGARDLADAAELLQIAGRASDAVRVVLAQATALRANGELELAAERAQQVLALAPHGTPLCVSAETELAESRLLQGRTSDAIAGYTRALDHGRSAGLLPVAQAALQRRIAMAWSIAGRADRAAEAAGEAAQLYERAGRTGESAAARVEAASALTAAGLAGPAARAVDDARAAAGDDPAALADLALLDSARALAAGHAEQALAHAREARAFALRGDSIVAYFGAAVAIAALLDHAGDRAGAYDSLAVGWVTAADRIGEAAAAALFSPRLTELRIRWGDAAFVAVKQAYYAERRRS